MARVNGVSASPSVAFLRGIAGPRPAAIRLAVLRFLAASRPVLLPVAAAVAGAAAWEWGTRLAHVPPAVLPPPSAVWERLQEALPILLQQSVPTVIETLVGFALAAVAGTVLGAACVLSRRLSQALYPWLLMFQLIPKVALAPLFIVWLGIGPASRLSFVVFMAFFPVVIATMTGLMSVDRGVLRLCASLTATPWQVLVGVRVPWALPHLFAGLKIAATMTVIGVVVAEFVTAQEGLGYLIMFAAAADDTALAFAAVAGLCVIGLALYGAVAVAEAVIERLIGVAMTSGEF